MGRCYRKILFSVELGKGRCEVRGPGRPEVPELTLSCSGPLVLIHWPGQPRLLRPVPSSWPQAGPLASHCPVASGLPLLVWGVVLVGGFPGFFACLLVGFPGVIRRHCVPAGGEWPLCRSPSPGTDTTRVRTRSQARGDPSGPCTWGPACVGSPPPGQGDQEGHCQPQLSHTWSFSVCLAGFGV